MHNSNWFDFLAVRPFSTRSRLTAPTESANSPKRAIGGNWQDFARRGQESIARLKYKLHRSVRIDSSSHRSSLQRDQTSRLSKWRRRSKDRRAVNPGQDIIVERTRIFRWQINNTAYSVVITCFGGRSNTTLEICHFFRMLAVNGCHVPRAEQQKCSRPKRKFISRCRWVKAPENTPRNRGISKKNPFCSGRKAGRGRPE